eukprot:403375515
MFTGNVQQHHPSFSQSHQQSQQQEEIKLEETKQINNVSTHSVSTGAEEEQVQIDTSTKPEMIDSDTQTQRFGQPDWTSCVKGCLEAYKLFMIPAVNKSTLKVENVSVDHTHQAYKRFEKHFLSKLPEVAQSLFFKDPELTRLDVFEPDQDISRQYVSAASFVEQQEQKLLDSQNLYDQLVLENQKCLLQNKDQTQKLNEYFEQSQQDAQRVQALMEQSEQDDQKVSALMEQSQKDALRISSLLEKSEQDDQKVSALMEKSEQDDQKVSALMEQCQQDASRVSALMEQSQQDAQRISALMEQSQKDASRVSALLEEREDFIKKSEVFDIALQEKDCMIQELQNEISLLRSQLDDQSSKTFETENILQEERDKISNMENQCEQTSKSLALKDREIQRLISLNKQLIEDLYKAQNDVSDGEKDIENLKNDYAKLTEQHEKTKTQMSQMEIKNKALKDQNDVLAESLKQPAKAIMSADSTSSSKFHTANQSILSELPSKNAQEEKKSKQGDANVIAGANSAQHQDLNDGSKPQTMNPFMSTRPNQKSWINPGRVIQQGKVLNRQSSPPQYLGQVLRFQDNLSKTQRPVTFGPDPPSQMSRGFYKMEEQDVIMQSSIPKTKELNDSQLGNIQKSQFEQQKMFGNTNMQKVQPMMHSLNLGGKENQSYQQFGAQNSQQTNLAQRDIAQQKRNAQHEEEKETVPSTTGQKRIFDI